ncbi:MAG TPA: amino acid adenylation domain-containing protein [Opitutaceae bacterium]
MSSADADRKALLDLLLAEEGLTADPGLALTPRADPAAPGPLSFAQQRLWFLDQFEPGGSAYNVPGALRLKGSLDAGALRWALVALGERQDVLRTVFVAAGDAPVAKLAPGLAPGWREIDLGELPAGERDGVLQAAIRAEAAATFDLVNGPLLRAVLVRLAPEDHALLVTMHHIVSDQWSLGLLTGELAAGYRAATTGTGGLVRPAVQYADFAAWQRAWSETPACTAQIDYWRKQLAGTIALELPTAGPRPARPSAAGGTVAFTIPADVRMALEKLAQAEGATLFMALLAAFKVLLHRYTEQRDLAVGTPVTGRSRPETAPLIGFFTNTLVLRTAVTGEPNFRDWLRAVRATCLDAYAHQDAPFELLVEALQPARELNRNPFFDVMFVLQTELPSLALPGVTAQFIPTEIPEAKFDLTLTVREAAGGALEGWVEFRKDLFAADAMTRLAGHYRNLVSSAAAMPDAVLLDLPMMDAAERRLVMETFNATDVAYPRTGEPLLHALVEAHVDRTPDAPALVDAAELISYAEMERRANRLAHRLRELGVGPDVIVGLSLARTLDMVIGVLGVLKAGGAYLPLDPGYPADRVAYMLDDARAPVLVTHAETRGKLPIPAGVVELDLDLEAERLAALPVTRPTTGVVGANLLYTIYTSGSTGRPKGTTLPHAAMYNLLRWHHANLLNGARGLLFASLSFDVSFHDIFAVLGTGGELHIATEEHRGDVSALVDYLERARIEKIVLPVVVFQQIAADYGDVPARFAALREVTTTGEALILTPAILELCAKLPHCALHNHYGPAETHVVTAYSFEGPPRRLNPPPPIGRPIANTQIHILDARFNPVPVGVGGELYIGGANLGRDYYRRPELTAQKFIPNPFGRTPGERLYRTGDRARWLPDGNLEFFGRLDDQVKIRGFRVELGEVETTLIKHAGVAGAAVAVRERAPGDKCLAAFFVRTPGAEVTPAELRAHVAGLLPDYMVPAVFVPLATLPLTPSGKIHRAGLPAVDARHFENAAAFVPPAGEAEAFVAEVWSGLLGSVRVGREDNFFHLGGHSLLATRVVSRLRARTTLEFPLRLLFEHPTLAGFTAALATVAGGPAMLDEVVRTVRAVEAMSEAEVTAATGGITSGEAR